MTPRVGRLLVLLCLVGLTWSLLAQFVWSMADVAHRHSALPYGGLAFGAYLLTIGYAVYYRTHWAKPRVVTGRAWSPMLRWAVTIVVVGAFGVTIGVVFPESMNTTRGQLFVQTVTFGMVGVGLVSTLSKRPSTTLDVQSSLTPSADAQPPTFGSSVSRVGAWQVYGFVGAALLFAPIYLVMKGFETYVDIPACERTCEAHGYTYENLVTGKSTYKCQCKAGDARHTFHDRAHIGGGRGALSAAADWFIRVATVLGVLGAWLALLFWVGHFVGSRHPDGSLARLMRAATGLVSTSQEPATQPRHSPSRKLKNRGRRRGRG